MQKLILTVLVGIGMGIGSVQAAEVIVGVAPPPAVIETRPVAPHGHYVWVGGYHHWDGQAYGWVPGRWDVPPHGRSVWVGHRWAHRHGGYVFVEGHWR